MAIASKTTNVQGLGPSFKERVELMLSHVGDMTGTRSLRAARSVRAEVGNTLRARPLGTGKNVWRVRAVEWYTAVSE